MVRHLATPCPTCADLPYRIRLRRRTRDGRPGPARGKNPYSGSAVPSSSRAPKRRSFSAHHPFNQEEKRRRYALSAA